MNSRIWRKWRISVGITMGLLALVWLVVSVVAQGPGPEREVQIDNFRMDAVNSRISYQGQLKENGQPVTGNRDMVFSIFTNNICSGIPVYQSPLYNVEVTDGIFSVNVDVQHSVFGGWGLWLEVEVESTPIGCEEIVPVPYALSLRPGATIYGEPTSWDGWVLNVEIEGTYPIASGVQGTAATGSAVRGESAGGNGVYGYSEDGYAVRGINDGTTTARGYGGHFTSQNGVGVYGYSSAQSYVSNMYAPGVYGRSANGVGVYGATDSTSWPGYGGFFEGRIGVGARSSGTYAEDGYAGTFYSENYRGIYASSHEDWYAGYLVNRGGSTMAGLYVDGTLWTTGAKTGYVVDVALNDGPEPLETGDVVVVTGFTDPVAGEIPVIRVRLATEAESTAVVGVAEQPLVVSDSTRDGQVESLPHSAGVEARVANGTAIDPGEYLNIVTLGSFMMIKADASYGSIRPGDLLVASPNPGYAMRTDNPRLGTIIGKALGELDEGTGLIPVVIMLQ